MVPETPTLDQLKDDRYTGPRRCWKCTAANLGLLVVATGSIWLLWPPLALALAIAGTIQIWLRGYLVPYTPRIVWRAASYVDRDSNRPDSERAGQLQELTGDDGPDEAIVDRLIETGVLTELDGELDLTPQFHDRLWKGIRTNRELNGAELADRLRATLDVARDVRYVDTDDGTWVVAETGDEAHEELWIRHHLAIVDLAVLDTLATFADVDPERSVPLAPAIRTLLDRCPLCEGDLAEGISGTCCGGPTSVYAPPDVVRHCHECSVAVAKLET